MIRSAPDLVLGLDLGTSSVKAGLYDAAGRTHGSGQAGYPITRGQGGLAEQLPEDWWQAASAAVRQALREGGVAPERVAAAGLSGQVGTHVLLDRAGQPLRPAISWQDTRARLEAVEVRDRLGRARLAENLGLDLPPGAAWPLPRLLWLSRHAPADLARAWRLLLAKDYVAFRLTGELATDASSWRGLLRLPGAEIAVELLRELDLPLDLLAARLPPSAVMGHVSPAAAEACGLAAGTPVVTGWNDLNCGLLGTGVVRPGMGFDIGGTSEHLGLALPAGGPLPADGLMLAPYLGDDLAGASRAARVCYGVTSAGGGSLDWYANALAHAAGTQADLEAAAASAPPGAGGLIFLPYLNGERAPMWDADARGVFFGLNSAHRQAHFARAVLEGVAFSLRQVLALVEAAAGARVDRLHASGGPARLALWNQIKADVLGRPLVIPRETHAACLGAAMLAAIGSGWFSGAAPAAEAMVQFASDVQPNPANSARYDALFAVYAGLYPQLRGAYAQLAAINLTEETQT